MNSYEIIQKELNHALNERLDDVIINIEKRIGNLKVCPGVGENYTWRVLEKQIADYREMVVKNQSRDILAELKRRRQQRELITGVAKPNQGQNSDTEVVVLSEEESFEKALARDIASFESENHKTKHRGVSKNKPKTHLTNWEL